MLGEVILMLKINEFTESNAREMCLWNYENEYAVYNCPDWETAVRQQWGMTNAEKRKNQFRSVIDESGNFIGFFRMSIKLKEGEIL